MSNAARTGASSIRWVVDLAITDPVVLPSGETVDRESFFGWLWAQCGEQGLMGIFEGALDAAEAVAVGLIDTPRVIDAAAAPAERDWVGHLAAPSVSLWFGDETAALDAVRQFATVGGCRVQGLRGEPEVDDGGAWRHTFGPVEVPGFGEVRPAWDEGEAVHRPGRTTIFIEPGAGFGTGQHETTQLCLAAITAWREEAGGIDRVLDFGSGSGILAIAAAVCGAGHVEAVEVDHHVHEAIRANARRNGVAERLRIAASVAADAAAFDLVCANIVAAVLLAHAEPLCRRVRLRTDGGIDGCLVLSGLLADDVPAVVERYSALLGTRPTITRRGDWHCLRFATDRAGAPACR